jgi:hypothetical protein
MVTSGQLHALSYFIPDKTAMLEETRSRSGCYGEQKHLLSLSEIEHRFIELTVSIPVTMWNIIQCNLYKAEPHGTENIFHIGQISALYKINNTDSSGRDYKICSRANFRLIQVPPYKSFTVLLLMVLQLLLLGLSGDFSR